MRFDFNKFIKITKARNAYRELEFLAEFGILLMSTLF